MKKKQDLLVILQFGLVAMLLVIGLFFATTRFQSKEIQNSVSTDDGTEEKNTQQDLEDKIEYEQEDNDIDTEINEESIYSKIPSVTTAEETKTSTVQENTTTGTKDKEETVVTYFENSIISIENAKDENNPTIREQVKKTFTETVDFLFYGSTIKGYTFKDLAIKTKLKIVELTLKLDHKIDTHFPNYKDKIKEKATNLKGRAALLYLETTSKLCESVGENACQEARTDFKNMKNSFGFTWDIIKEGATFSSSSLKIILSEWYQSIKE